MEIRAQRVRQLRTTRNWTQQQLADACGMSLRTVQRIEKMGNASNESVAALCAVFEVPLTEVKWVPKPDTMSQSNVAKFPIALMLGTSMLVGILIGVVLTWWLAV